MVSDSPIRLPPAPPNDLYRLGGNVAGQYKRAAALALQVGLGNISGIAASNIYRAKDAPRYKLGRKLQTRFTISFGPLTLLTPSADAIELGLVGMGLTVLPIIVITYKRINARKEAVMKEAGESGGSQHTDEELRRMGDKAPNFQYGI